MSTLSGGPNIIMDGLLLNLDAGNTKSYVSGSTIWNDLSRQGNNGILTNGPTFNGDNGGSIVFDGVDDRVTKVGAIDTGQNFTVNAWIRPTLLGTTRRAIVGNGYPYTGRVGWLFCTSGANTINTFFLTIGADAAYKVAAANTLTLNNWQYVTATIANGGSTIDLYKNAQTTNTSISVPSSGTITYTNPEFNIGARNTLNQLDPYTGNIAGISIYNRVLSLTETLQNFNATRARFGI